jgi:hypothetical protein
MLKIRFFLLSILCFFSTLGVKAQVEKGGIPLEFVLQEISEYHNVKFNYLEEDVEIFLIIPPDEALPLEEKIDYIKKKTFLTFTIIDSKYYTVSKNNRSEGLLCGYIINNENGKPLENVVLTILNTVISTATNQKGYFELPSITRNKIEISHIGYHIVTINPQDLSTIPCTKVMLNPITLQLNEVVAQRYLTAGISKQIEGDIVIKPKKFGILPGLIEPDVLQTMQQIPGIYSTDEIISNINVRGGTHDQNLFLWNGIRMFQTGHFFGLISAFNPSLAHTIAIAKNGTSAFYDDGVSSLVDISSHSKSIENSQNSISINLISAEFYSKFKASKSASFEISGRRSFTDVLETPTYENYRNRIFQNTIVTNLNQELPIDIKTNEKFYFYDLSMQYQQKIGTQNEFTVDGIIIKNQLKINQDSDLEKRNSNLSQSNFGGNITWKTAWNENNSSQIQFSTSHYSLDSKNESLKINQTLNQQNDVNDIRMQIKNTHKIFENLSLNNGYQYNEMSIENFDSINSPLFFRKIKEVLKSHALIAEGIFQSESKKTFVKGGIRFNYFEKFKEYLIEPRIQFNQKLTTHLTLEIVGEQKSQTLSQVIDLQKDFLGIEKRRWMLANNENVPIQKSNQIAMGFSFKNKNWLFTLDNFYKKVTGITTSSQGFQNQFELVKSIGDYKVLGTEILIQKKFGEFYSWLSYSLNNNKYLFKSLTENAFPNNYELIHSLSWAAIYERENWKMALGSKWHSGKPYTSPVDNSINFEDINNPKINYNEANNAKLKGYFQLNFSASKDWELSHKMKFIWSFSVLNMLNTKNIINRFYRVNTNNKSIESIDTYSQEATPNINLKLLF